MDNDIKDVISKDKFHRYTVYASDYMNLDSSVVDGGGTDNTEILQSILDKACEWGRLHLIMNGAALVSGLTVYSNTTIECISKSCGFFLKPWSDCPVITNAHHVFSEEIEDENIILTGGTYNHNCREQRHDTCGPDFSGELHLDDFVVGIAMYGVKDFTVKAVTVRNQRTFAMLLINWYNVILHDINIELPDYMPAQNQDGIHLCGPGRFLDMRNIRGRSGDDFIALAPDEYKENVSMTDVLIDGVFLDNADQGIRLLSKSEKGRLDRIIIRNVSGTYRSFGFYILPFYMTGGGNYGNIVIENVNLNQSKPVYDYTHPFLFRIGGNIESITLKDIFLHCPGDNRSLIDIGWPSYSGWYPGTTVEDLKREREYRIDSIVIDGLHVFEKDDSAIDTDYIRIEAKVGNLIIRNSDIIRCKNNSNGCLIKTENDPEITNLIINDLVIGKVDSVIRHCSGFIKSIVMNTITSSDIGTGLIKLDGGEIQDINASAVVSNVDILSSKQE